MYEDKEPMYQWQAPVAAPHVDQEDLRFNPNAEEIHSDAPGLTLLALHRDSEATRWLQQGPDGRRKAVEDVQARFSTPVFRNQRTIRVFLSSTFRDMQVERNYLVTAVFPRLKRLAQSHGVLLQEIDLRWGITAEEAHRGETVAICLDEIDRCRACPPFFIGLLGERYGWIPDAPALDALDRAMASRANGEASLEMRGRARRDAYSVTEMEIRYGVLDTPEMTGHAFFYNRAPELTHMFAQQAAEPNAAQIYYEADAACAARQEALKHALRERGLVRMDGYRSVQELGDDIERAITAAIMRVARSVAAVQQQTAAPLPLGWQTNQTLNDIMGAERVIFENRDPQADAVTRAWADREQPGAIRLMLVGPPGIGKAHEALGLATLTRFWELGAPVVALHCRTGTATNADGAFGFVRSALAAFSAIPPAQPLGRTGLRETLLAINRPVVLQITDIDLLGGASDLVDMLGLVQNPRLAIILTTSDATLGQRATGAFNVRTLGDLSREERETFAREYLARYRKSLDTQAMHKLVSMPLAGSPSFLTLVLDELRRSALFETLDATLDVYASMSTFEQAFLHSLQAWLGHVGAQHRDSDRWRAMLEVLCLARQGVPDDFFTANAGPGLSTLQWMTWQGLAEPALVDVGGSWRLRNAHLRDIVFKHCFGDNPNALAQVETRRRLANYIGAVPAEWDVSGLIERTQQMLWLTRHTGAPEDVQGLYETLSVRNNIGALYVCDSGLLFEGWRELVSKGISLTPLIDMTIESTDPTWPYLLGRLLIQFECWADLERFARGVIAGQHVPEAAHFDYQLGLALVNQSRPAEALEVIAPRIHAWAAAPQATLPPTSLGILMGLITDGEIDSTPWGPTLDAALQALIEMGPANDPELQLVLISCAMPLLLGTPHFTLMEALARRAMLMSYDLPGAEGSRVRLLMGFPLINALRSQSKFDEAVTAGFAVLATQTSPFPQEAILRARCARATGQSLLGLSRWDDAAELLEYALTHEPQDDADVIPLLLNTAFLAICMIELKQWPRVRPLLEAFVTYGGSLPEMRNELQGWLVQHLRNAGQLEEVRWLESTNRAPI